MEMLSSIRGDKHEFCLVVIKFKHVRSCSSFDITYTCFALLCFAKSISDVIFSGADLPSLLVTSSLQGLFRQVN